MLDTAVDASHTALEKIDSAPLFMESIFQRKKIVTIERGMK